MSIDTIDQYFKDLDNIEINYMLQYYYLWYIIYIHNIKCLKTFANYLSASSLVLNYNTQ